MHTILTYILPVLLAGGFFAAGAVLTPPMGQPVPAETGTPQARVFDGRLQVSDGTRWETIGSADLLMEADPFASYEPDYEASEEEEVLPAEEGSVPVYVPPAKPAAKPEQPAPEAPREESHSGYDDSGDDDSDSGSGGGSDSGDSDSGSGDSGDSGGDDSGEEEELPEWSEDIL